MEDGAGGSHHGTVASARRLARTREARSFLADPVRENGWSNMASRDKNGNLISVIVYCTLIN